jgi:3-oxoacyl-[acyl-carrier-protein] synthase-3
LLVLCTQNPDYKLPHTSAIIQDRLGLDSKVAAFDINLGCSGFVYSLSIAKAFMKTHRIKYGLILTSDPYSKIIFPGDKDTLPIFGDAATATLLSEDGGFKIKEFSFGTDGSGCNELIVKYGKTSYSARSQQSENKDYRSSFLYMNGRAIFNFMMTRVPENVLECLKLNKLEIDEIDYFIFHQAGKYMLDNLRKTLGIEKEKVIISIENTGNTVSSSIPIALKPFLHKKNYKKKFLLSGFGVGLSWASTVLNT